MDKQAILEIIQPKKDLWEKSFDNVQVMLLTIGFPRSGSSLVGYLLAAHPSMVIADEPLVLNRGVALMAHINNINGIKLRKTDCLYSADLNKIFNVVLSVDYVRWLVAKKREPSK